MAKNSQMTWWESALLCCLSEHNVDVHRVHHYQWLREKELDENALLRLLLVFFTYLSESA